MVDASDVRMVEMMVMHLECMMAGLKELAKVECSDVLWVETMAHY